MNKTTLVEALDNFAIGTVLGTLTTAGVILIALLINAGYAPLLFIGLVALCFLWLVYRNRSRITGVLKFKKLLFPRD